MIESGRKQGTKNALSRYSLMNEMTWGHFCTQRWVRPRDVARYYGCTIYKARDCLQALVDRGELEAAPDNLDGRKSKYRLRRGPR